MTHGRSRTISTTTRRGSRLPSQADPGVHPADAGATRRRPGRGPCDRAELGVRTTAICGGTARTGNRRPAQTRTARSKPDPSRRTRRRRRGRPHPRSGPQPAGGPQRHRRTAARLVRTHPPADRPDPLGCSRADTDLRQRAIRHPCPARSGGLGPGPAHRRATLVLRPASRARRTRSRQTRPERSAAPASLLPLGHGPHQDSGGMARSDHPHPPGDHVPHLVTAVARRPCDAASHSAIPPRAVRSSIAASESWTATASVHNPDRNLPLSSTACAQTESPAQGRTDERRPRRRRSHELHLRSRRP